MLVRICDIHGDFDNFVGKKITVQGRLVVTSSDQSFLTVDYDNYKRGIFLSICDSKQIATQLIKTLPIYVGGDCLYDEEAVITGMIVRDSIGFQLAHLQSCSVFRGDTEIAIQFKK